MPKRVKRASEKEQRQEGKTSEAKHGLKNGQQKNATGKAKQGLREGQKRPREAPKKKAKGTTTSNSPVVNAKTMPQKNATKATKMAKKPSFYTPPPPNELTNNTDFPNLNTMEYRLKKLQITKPQSFWEILEVDTLGQIVLVTNDYVTRMWNGSFWGYENLDDVGSAEKAVYGKIYDHLITGFKFVEPNIALVSDSSGGLNLWSTKAEIRNGYCAYSIARRSEHVGRIDVLELCHKDGIKALTGSTDCCIKVWDLGGADLCSSFTYRFAHAGQVTGLSSSHSMPTVFSSCSRDKKWAIWDHRQSRPITTLSLTHFFPYTTLYWSDNAEKYENLFIGDETGCVYVFDIRNPLRYVEMLQVYDGKPIHNLSFEGNCLAVLGQTNVLKVFDTSKANKEIYSNSDAQSNVRDLYWTDVDSFYTIAWGSGMHKHKLPTFCKNL
ncbi:Protein valois [Pseudolycoriella hygida]|uniref:Protein valois n=1 Tax=Pseudolycoriella hygida TaxID=35572 RepID=A0A9Q0SAE8_9DIPT|nr:Protein valois [Pseudolycoriella hygida]